MLARWPASGNESEGLETLATAERAGFDALWLLDRAADDDGALLLAAALAEQTERIRIGIAGAPPASLHPLRLAEDLAMLDLVSDGRLDWIPIEGDASRARAGDEAIEIVLRAWLGESFAHDGLHHAFPELTCFPRPRQSPHPHLWLARRSARPSAADPAALGHWVDDPIDFDSDRGGEPRALVCSVVSARKPAEPVLAASETRATGLRGPAPGRAHADFPLEREPGRGVDRLIRWVERAAPDLLIVAPTSPAPLDAAAIGACFAFADAVRTRSKNSQAR